MFKNPRKPKHLLLAMCCITFDSGNSYKPVFPIHIFWLLLGNDEPYLVSSKMIIFIGMLLKIKCENLKWNFFPGRQTVIHIGFCFFLSGYASHINGVWFTCLSACLNSPNTHKITYNFCAVFYVCPSFIPHIRLKIESIDIKTDKCRDGHINLFLCTEVHCSFLPCSSVYTSFVLGLKRCCSDTTRFNAATGGGWRSISWMLERGVILQRTSEQLQTSPYFAGRCTEQNFLVDIKRWKSYQCSWCFLKSKQIR